MTKVAARSTFGLESKHMSMVGATMRITLLLLALVSIGCKDTPTPKNDALTIQVFEKNKQLDSRVQALEAENKIAYNSLAEYRASNEQLKNANAILTGNVAYYKNELATLNKKYALSVADAVKSEPANSRAESNVSSIKADTPVAPDSSALERSVADLQKRIELLRPRVGAGRSKIASLVRATIDQRMIPPPGGQIINGQIYRRVLSCNYNSSNYTRQFQYGHTHDESCYRSEQIGPAVKAGDFRSARDKDDAIRGAKEENLPLEVELTSLEKQLIESKSQLGKLRTDKNK